MTLTNFMTGKHLMAGIAMYALAACNGNGASTDTQNNAADVKAAETVTAEVMADSVSEASSTCPASDVISDVSAYRNDHPAANDDYVAWHAENGKREGVVTTPSGLQYQIVKKGNPNGPSPLGSQIITVNYHGFFPNGDVFDSSYNRGQPIEFPANGVIKGWIEGLGTMKPCDAWTFYIPGELAYGPRGTRGIPPNATLGFHVQLLEVK